MMRNNDDLVGDAIEETMNLDLSEGEDAGAVRD